LAASKTEHVITVLIPTYNRKDRLKTALASVLSETRIPLRVSVFDNHSTDGTDLFLQQAAAEDNRISVTTQSSNIGATRNYIAALSSVATEFFVPLADDDRLLPDFLYQAYAQLVAAPTAGAAVFFGHYLKDDGELLCTFPASVEGTVSGFLPPEQHMREFMLRGHYHWSAILWRKPVLDHVGLPFFHTGLPSDVDFQIQVFSHFPVVLTRDVGAIFTAHDNQHSSNYSMSDIPSFTKLATRMDKSAGPLFAKQDYQELRSNFLSRYTDMWRGVPPDPIPSHKLLLTAALAIAHLGDKDVASYLLNEALQDENEKPASLLARLVTEVVATHKMLEDVKQAWLDQPISFQKIAFVDKSAVGGGFRERSGNVFRDEESIVVYSEPVGHIPKQNDDGTYSSGFEVDLLLTKPDGQILIDHKNFQKPEYTCNLRTDKVVIVLSLTLTAAPVGDYIVQYTFRDVESSKTGMLTVPVKITR
jgi:glycosyltransferase involved in cell wall biosynthesis